MEDLQHILIVDHQVEQGRQVKAGRLGIDRGGLVRVRDLHQAEIGPIAVFAHEFGIDRNIGRFGDPGAELGESLAVGNQRMDLHMVFDLIMGWPVAHGLVNA